MTHPTVTCITIPIFDNVFEILRFSLYFSDFRPIMSQTFFTITNLIDFGNTEIYFVQVSNSSVCFSLLKSLFHVVNAFINFYTQIP